MSTSSTLLYEPLSSDQNGFRLLALVAGREHEALQSHLTHATLSDPAVVYETISYCWGDATARDSITVDGYVVDVPASAVAALKCMRKTEEPRVIWVDSICINQTDLDERAYQVGIMADIYRSAKGNLVYLGESDERTGDAFDMVERLYQEIRRNTSDFSEFHNLMRRHLHGGNHAEDKLECELDERALVSIFARPWFQRLWIVQEAALAAVNTCFCGRGFSISLNVLLRAAIWLCYHRTSLSPWFYDHDALHNAADLWSLVDDKDSGAASEYAYEQNLTSLLMRAQYRQSSDPRDKVFAVLSMLDKEPEFAPEFAPEMSLLRVDYRKPCYEVMRDATRYAIQELNSLNILQAATHRVTDQDIELDGCPSWVARIDRPFDEAHDAESLGDRTYYADAGQGLDPRDLRSDFIDHNVLGVSGYTISRISEVSDVFEPSIWEKRARVAEILRSLNVMVGKFDEKKIEWWSAYKTTNIELPSNMVRTVMLGMSPNSRKASDSDVLEFAALLEKLISYPSAPLDDDEEELYSSLRSSCSHRRFYTGTNGHIGMAHRCVRAGDKTAVLLGSSVPFALRPCETNDERCEGRTFQFLGDVWEFGVMEGDYAAAFEELGDLGLPEQFFLV